MKIYILRKSLSDLKNPIIKNEYQTEAVKVRDFIEEMVRKNYKAIPIKDTLENCIQAALDDFYDGCCYIINVTQNIKYASLEDAMHFCDGDEIMLVKLKYVRGIIW